MTIDVSLTVNGKEVHVSTPARTSLADLLREELHLTGTHLGCEHGVCGACTVLLDGVPVRSCIALAPSCAGADVVTVEGLQGPIADAVRTAFAAEHGLQCGFCTPGLVIAATDLVRRRPDATEDEVRLELCGNLCRCTGYVNIVRAVRRAAQSLAEAAR